MLKAKYIEALRKGRKKATIRLGKVDVKSREFIIHSGGRIIARAILKGVVYKKIKEITDDDARMDGLTSKEELLKELREHYGEIKDDDIVTIILFDIVEFLDKPEEKYPHGLKPFEIAKLALDNLELSEKERRILRLLVKTQSIRKTAKKIYGKLSSRWKIRKLLDKCIRLLDEKGILMNMKEKAK